MNPGTLYVVATPLGNLGDLSSRATEILRSVPVVAAEDDPAPAGAAGRIEIALGPAVVRVGADVDAAALRRVLEVVRGLA